MEKQRVEEPFARQFQEIVPVQRRAVVERDADVAHGRVQQHLGPGLPVGLAAGGEKQDGRCRGCKAEENSIHRHLFYLCKNARSIAPTSIRSRRTR